MTLPEGLIFVPGFLTEAEERDVLAVLATFELQPYVLHDTPSRRLVRSFGLALVTGTYDLGPALQLWVREPPAGGQANAAAIRDVARWAGVAPSQVAIVSGAVARHKLAGSHREDALPPLAV